MEPFHELVESRIQEAMTRGEFDRLPGAGRPLSLDDDSFVPPEMRLAYRILRNAGYLPPELELRRDIRDLQAGLADGAGGEQRRRSLKKLQYLTMQMDESRRRQVNLMLQEEYYDKVLDSL